MLLCSWWSSLWRKSILDCKGITMVEIMAVSFPSSLDKLKISRKQTTYDILSLRKVQESRNQNAFMTRLNYWHYGHISLNSPNAFCILQKMEFIFFRTCTVCIDIIGHTLEIGCVSLFCIDPGRLRSSRLPSVACVCQFDGYLDSNQNWCDLEQRTCREEISWDFLRFWGLRRSLIATYCYCTILYIANI